VGCGFGGQVGLYRDNDGADPERDDPSAGEPAQVHAEAKCKVPSV
jgi:hypothetical protein